MTSFTSMGLTILPARLALAEAAVEKAFRIRPNAGEAHLARAFHLYNGYLDYDGALAELEIARRSLPNGPRIFSVIASIQRRQGRWEESIRSLERGIAFDPGSVNSDLLTEIDTMCGVMLNKNRSWIAR